jgi:hypothetical protein
MNGSTFGIGLKSPERTGDRRRTIWKKKNGKTPTLTFHASHQDLRIKIHPGDLGSSRFSKVNP